MTYPENIKEKFISTQWSSFIEQSIVQIDLAREIYYKKKDSERHRNKRRKAISLEENIPASISLMLLNSAIEGLCNAQAFWEKEEKYNQWDPLLNKLKKLILNINSNLSDAVSEFDFVRNIIVHGYVWIKLRRYKGDFSFKYVKSYLWEPFKDNKKIQDIVDWRGRRTKNYKFSIIPTEINFLDALMALVITSEVIKLFGWDKHIRIYSSKQMGFSKDTSAIPSSDNFCRLEHWINYFKAFLSEYDKKNLDYLSNGILNTKK
jgi:hypothetical protein